MKSLVSLLNAEDACVREFNICESLIDTLTRNGGSAETIASYVEERGRAANAINASRAELKKAILNLLEMEDKHD